MKHFRAHAIIFDKDGTLIDFDAMWGGWVIYLAAQLQEITGLQVRAPLCLAMGYDDANKRVLAHGKLAATPMAQLFRLTVEAMQSVGLTAEQAERAVEQGWCIPDPVVLARQFTDTRALFQKIHSRNIQIGIATTDDRAPTQAMIEAFDIEEYITTMVCADDGIPVKPAPDMMLTICARMKVDPSKVMVVGDTTADLKMARAAGAGLVVGVLSGVSSAKDLIPFADVLIDSIDELHIYAQALAEHEPPLTQTGLNQDFAF
ncbi:MAG TPA: HAD family hydrolase [Anaerolineales bacterium]|nr:HAD family hydrolase [Anaerolineales bacterium]